MKLSRDTNGNKTLKIESTDLNSGRGFSIQTLGNLPETHRNGVGSWTSEEVVSHVRKYGTQAQQGKMELSKGSLSWNQ